MDLIDRCANRLGPLSGQLGARREKSRLFRVLDRPSRNAWLAASRVRIGGRDALLTLGRVIDFYTDFSSEQEFPTRDQLLKALRAGARLSRRRP